MMRRLGHSRYPRNRGGCSWECQGCRRSSGSPRWRPGASGASGRPPGHAGSKMCILQRTLPFKPLGLGSVDKIWKFGPRDRPRGRQAPRAGSGEIWHPRGSRQHGRSYHGSRKRLALADISNAIQGSHGPNTLKRAAPTFVTRRMSSSLGNAIGKANTVKPFRAKASVES